MVMLLPTIPAIFFKNPDAIVDYGYALADDSGDFSKSPDAIADYGYVLADDSGDFFKNPDAIADYGYALANDCDAFFGRLRRFFRPFRRFLGVDTVFWAARDAYSDNWT